MRQYREHYWGPEAPMHAALVAWYVPVFYTVFLSFLDKLSSC